MGEHSCTYLQLQAMQDQAVYVEAKTQQEFLARAAQRAEKARLDREGMQAVVEDFRKTFEAERLAMAQAVREREQELLGQISCQTTAAKRIVEEEEADNRFADMIASERQAVISAGSRSVDASAVSAAAAVARIEGERIATAGA
eukprot:7656740-Pyramimonas_sp.AAC.1